MHTISTSTGTIAIDHHSIHFNHYTQQDDLSSDTFVLLHDSLGSVSLWRNWPELLAAALKCNVFVYDRVGYGQSSAMDTPLRANDYLEQEAHFLKRIVDIMQFGVVSVFGHSDGGSIALLYGALYPSVTKSIVCEAGHVFVEEITLAGVRLAAKQYAETDLPLRLAKYHGNNVGNMVQAWVGTWLNPEFRDWNVLELMEKITSPLLFIQGDLDEYGSLDQMYETLNRVNGPKVGHVFTNIGHIPHKECKQETLDVVVDFIQSL